MVILKFPVLYLLVAAGFLPGCAKDLDGNTSFKQANKGFENELPAAKRNGSYQGTPRSPGTSQLRTQTNAPANPLVGS